MSIICTILFYVCSSHAQTPLNDISGTNTIYSASEVDYRLASKVPTNRTITVDGQVGSLETNLVFSSSSENVTRLYNPTNSLEWYEIRCNEKWTYAVTIYSNLWSYSCDKIDFYDPPPFLTLALPQSGVFELGTPPITGTDIATPIVAEGGGFFHFQDYGALCALWVLRSPDGSVQDASFGNDEISSSWGNTVLRWLGENYPVTNITVSTLSTASDLDTHNSDASAHPAIQSKLYALPTQPSLSLTNLFSTNINSRLVISASNGVLRVQEVSQ